MNYTQPLSVAPAYLRSFLFGLSALLVTFSLPCTATEEPSQEDINGQFIEVIDEQLNAIRSDELDKAYHQYTTDAFKQYTPFEVFRESIQHSPAFTEFVTVSFGDGKIHENGEGEMQIMLFTEDQKYPVSYVLTEENGQWKILGFGQQDTFVDSSGEPVALAVDEAEKSDLTHVIEGHLNNIKHNGVPKAYNDTSKKFMEATSLEQYQDFVKAQPELTEFTSIQFGEMKADNLLRLIPATLISSKGNSEVDFYLVKEDNHWKIWGINIVRSPSYPLADEQEKKELLDVIHRQLMALKDHDFPQAYYAFTSDEFKKAVPFDTFQQFVETYPAFVKHSQANADEVFVEGNLRLVRLAVNTDHGVAKFDYRLIKENNQWRIWGIQVFAEEVTPEAPHHKEDVISVIQEQLETLRLGDLSKAYSNYTAKEFQEASSKEDFKKFIDDHPVFLKNTSVKINEIAFEHNLATVDVELTSEAQKKIHAEYRLVFHENSWKVLSIRIVDSPSSVALYLEAEQTTEHKIDVEKAVMGSSIDLQGLVTNPTTLFHPDTQKITVNFYLMHGRRGEPIQILLEHVESHSNVPVLSIPLTQDGDSIVTFIVTPPTQGWPEGNYKITVTGKDLNKAFTFKVEPR